MQITDLLLISLTVLSNFSTDASSSLPINNVCGDPEQQTLLLLSAALFKGEKPRSCARPSFPRLLPQISLLQTAWRTARLLVGKVCAIGTDFGSQQLDML